MQVFIGNIVHSLGPDEMEILVDHAIGVEAGRIAFIKPAAECAISDNAIRLSPTQFLCPGFVDTHVHAPQYPNCGIFGNSTLLDWLTTYTFPLEAKFAKDEALANEVYSTVVRRQLSNGTTMASYFGTSDCPSTLVLAAKCLEFGQKAQIGRVCMERFCIDDLCDGELESDLKFIEGVEKMDPKREKVWPVLTPRFAPSCEFETLIGLGQLAEQKSLPVQTHLNENAKEIEWVASLFPEARNYTDVYHRAKLLKQDTVLAHGVHFSGADELELVKQQQSGISHCPNSNASIASGIAPIKRYLEMGLKVGLGTDVSGGSSISILKNARLAVLMSRLLSEKESDLSNNLSVANALYLATLGGASLLDQQANTGNFVVGKWFDAQLVDIQSRDTPIDIFEAALPTEAKERVENFVNKWLYIGDDRNTVKVWVDGEVVHEK